MLPQFLSPSILPSPRSATRKLVLIAISLQITRSCSRLLLSALPAPTYRKWHFSSPSPGDPVTKKCLK
ncbi:MFS transporter [Histoplasma capsulatum]|uniref:MFS transporter n=1 Tax=Ajellomyces capsulatus TaxID=5037 RepID=A0A8A1MIV0_AJECA|nr:MFS transporter [Histoplasma capsulatum]